MLRDCELNSYERELDNLVGGVRRKFVFRQMFFFFFCIFWQVSHLLVKRFRSVHQYFFVVHEEFNVLRGHVINARLICLLRYSA